LPCRWRAAAVPAPFAGRPLRAFTPAALLFFLESERGLPIDRLGVSALLVLVRLADRRLAACLFRSAVADEIGRQLVMLFERPAGAHGALQNDARCCHGRRDNTGILTLPRSSLVEKVVSAPLASRAAFIEGAATARSKKPSEVSYVFSFLAIRVHSCAAGQITM
jgi:hypothetical protein